MSRRALKAVTITCSILIALAALHSIRLLASGQPDAQPVVHGITIHNAPGGAVTVDISVAPAAPYQTMHLARPDRLVVDLAGAHEADLKGDYPAQSSVLERVRASQWKSDPAVVRVVADLKGNPSFSIKSQDTGIRIEIRPQVASRGKENTSGAAAEAAERSVKARTQTAQDDPPLSTVFSVHRFKDLSASLTAPVLPPHDKLIPVANPDLSRVNRREPKTLAEVTGISIKPDSKGETTIDIASTHSVPYRVFQLTNPFRLVIDLKDARNSSKLGVYQVDSPVLKRVRVAQWRPNDPPVVRVVAELEGYPIFDVYAQRPGVHVELKSRQPVESVVRNPFEFRTERQNVQPGRPAAPPNPVITAAANPAAAATDKTFSDLTLIGLIEKKGGETQAIISDHGKVYIVPKGETFENNFQVLGISANAVEIQDTTTAKTSWIPYSH